MNDVDTILDFARWYLVRGPAYPLAPEAYRLQPRLEEYLRAAYRRMRSVRPYVATAREVALLVEGWLAGQWDPDYAELPLEAVGPTPAAGSLTWEAYNT